MILIKYVENPGAPTGVLTDKVVVPRAEGDVVLKETKEPLTFAPRSMFLTKAILQRFGHTASCAKCRALCRGELNTTLTHAKECRERLERAVAQDKVLKRKLDNAEERKTKYFADEIERAVKRSSRTEKQFAASPNTELFGGATSSSDPCESSIVSVCWK